MDDWEDGRGGRGVESGCGAGGAVGGRRGGPWRGGGRAAGAPPRGVAPKKSLCAHHTNRGVNAAGAAATAAAAAPRARVSVGPPWVAVGGVEGREGERRRGAGDGPLTGVRKWPSRGRVACPRASERARGGSQEAGWAWVRTGVARGQACGAVLVAREGVGWAPHPLPSSSP